MTAAKECFLGVGVIHSADESALTQAYGEFQQEALALNPDYCPDTVNTDGWDATQQAWKTLFPGITLMLCFLHTVLGIHQHCRRDRVFYKSVTDKLWGLFHALNPRQFGQCLRRLQEWATTNVSHEVVLKEQSTAQTLYGQDYYLWLQTTLHQLRGGQLLSAVDLENLLEELESMGRREKRTVKSLLIRLLEHLLKLKYWSTECPQNEGHWKGEIRTFRRELRDVLQDSPSLKPCLLEILTNATKPSDLRQAIAPIFPLRSFPSTSSAP